MLVKLIISMSSSKRPTNVIAAEAYIFKGILLLWVLRRNLSMDHISSFYHLGNTALIQNTTIKYELKIMLVLPLDEKSSK